LECRGELMRWRQIKGHKAFVVGRRSDIEYCGWSWKAASKEAATAAATSACKKAGAWDCTVHAAE
jgi:hypothetical protein